MFYYDGMLLFGLFENDIPKSVLKFLGVVIIDGSYMSHKLEILV